MSRIISQTLANEEISNHLKSSDYEILNKSRTLISSNPDTYYTDEPVSFVFGRADLEHLFSLNETDEPNAFKIYMARNENDEFTLVLVPCIADFISDGLGGENASNIRNLVGSATEAGGQYPDRKGPRFSLNASLTDGFVFDIANDNDL